LHLILIIWFSNGAQPPDRTPLGKAQGIKKKEQTFHPINSLGAQPSCAGSYQRRSKNDGASLNSPRRIFPFFSRRASSGPYE
jgi:hypothetical protein